MSRGPFFIGDTFVPCGVQHWTVFVVMTLATLVLSRLLRRTAGSPHETAVRRGVCWPLAGVLLAGAAAGQIQRIVAGVWSLQESLPLHLCDIAVFVCAAALVGAGLHRPGVIMEASRAHPTGSNLRTGLSPLWQRCYELAYIWGLGGTSQAVLTPDVQGVFPAQACLRYFLLHGGIIVAVLTMTIGLRMRPLPGTPQRVWLTTLVLAVVVFPIDWALKANYMYLRARPANPTLIDLFGPWPWSLLPLAAAGTVLILLCYAPFWLMDRRRTRRAAITSPRGL